jgi:prepilin-type processing-associated H-X9-DG protein
VDENLVGYLLNSLDEPTTKAVEAYLAREPEGRVKLAQLRQALEPLAADDEAPTPPARLVERTLARISERMSQPSLPQAPPASPATLPLAPSWWRRPDILIAACLLITIAGIGLTVLGSLRGPTSAAVLVECKNNLRQFYVALQQYRTQNGQLPDVTKESPHDVAGMVVPMLNDAGALPSSTSIRCPGIGAPLSCSFTLANLRAMSDAEFERCAPSLALCYAYSLGFRDGEVLRGPGDYAQASWSQTPIMADRPPAVGVLSNSINHGGTGQNVLFADGHVKFLPKRTLGAGDDIFLNREGIVAAGVDASDIVLGHSGARPK